MTWMTRSRPKSRSSVDVVFSLSLMVLCGWSAQDVSSIQLRLHSRSVDGACPAEHHTLYQYSLIDAQDHYMGLIQTETVRRAFPHSNPSLDVVFYSLTINLCPRLQSPLRLINAIKILSSQSPIFLHGQ